MIKPSFPNLLPLAACFGILADAQAARAQVPVVTQSPAVRFYRANALPAPYITKSVRNPPHLTPRPAGAPLRVPPGFTIAKWAGGLQNPRFLTVAPNGDVFVAESQPGIILVLRPAAGNAAPAATSELATGLTQPFGIAFYPRGPNPKFVYIGDTNAVLRYPYHNGDLRSRGPAKLLIHLPGGGYRQHWTRTIVVSPDNRKIYVSIGSQENIGVEQPPRACIMQYNPDGSGAKVYASGLRNAVGLAFSPVTRVLWAAVNERDQLGDNVPPDYLTSVRPGGFYGWPYYYIGDHPDMRVPRRPGLASKVIVPDVLLEPHGAPLSVSFGQESNFPDGYKTSIYVAEHGSWNRSSRSGYKVLRALTNSRGCALGGYKDFVWGWATPAGTVWGRPVCTAFAKDGSLLITDDGGNLIWRVSVKR